MTNPRRSPASTEASEVASVTTCHVVLLDRLGERANAHRVAKIDQAEADQLIVAKSARPATAEDIALAGPLLLDLTR